MKIELLEVKKLFASKEELKTKGVLLITESNNRTLLDVGEYQGVFLNFNKEVYKVTKKKADGTPSDYSEVLNVKAVFMVNKQQLYVDITEETVDFIATLEAGTLVTINVTINTFKKADGTQGSNNIGTLVPVLVTNPLTK